MTTRTYVLDTSVLLSDPWAVTRFAEHHVVLPLVVIGELEGKRHHHELGWFAREALRLLDDLRLEHGRLDIPSSGSTIRCAGTNKLPRGGGLARDSPDPLGVLWPLRLPAPFVLLGGTHLAA